MNQRGRISTVLLVALCVVGLLFWGAVLFPVCGCTTKAKAYVAATKSDLRNLITWQESFFADSARYAGRDELPAFIWSANVTLREFALGDSGWTAVAQHQASDVPCAIFVGSVTPLPPATEEGTPACREPRRSFLDRLRGR